MLTLKNIIFNLEFSLNDLKRSGDFQFLSLNQIVEKLWEKNKKDFDQAKGGNRIHLFLHIAKSVISKSLKIDVPKLELFGYYVIDDPNQRSRVSRKYLIQKIGGKSGNFTIKDDYVNTHGYGYILMTYGCVSSCSNIAILEIIKRWKPVQTIQIPYSSNYKIGKDLNFFLIHMARMIAVLNNVFEPDYLHYPDTTELYYGENKEWEAYCG